MVATWQSTGEDGARARLEAPAIRRQWVSGLALILMLLLTGCASVREHSLTYQLWNEKNLRKFSQPAPQPNLGLYETANHTQVLVQYDAVTEGQSPVKRKAYYLRPDQADNVTGQKPTFVKVTMAEVLKPIPIFPTEPDATNAPARPIPYAVAAPDSPCFTLHHDQGQARSINLPLYAEKSHQALRLAATPVAVVSDAFMFSLYECFVLYCGGEIPSAPH